MSTHLIEILARLGLASLPKQVVRKLTRTLEHEVGRRGGEALGRAICESIDAIMEAHDGALSADQSIAVGTALAETIATNLREAANKVEAYAPLQAAVVRAKVDPDNDLSVARKARNAGTAKVKEALQSVVPE